jgi:hypothetical protein
MTPLFHIIFHGLEPHSLLYHSQHTLSNKDSDNWVFERPDCKGAKAPTTATEAKKRATHFILTRLDRYLLDNMRIQSYFALGHDILSSKKPPPSRFYLSNTTTAPSYPTHSSWVRYQFRNLPIFLLFFLKDGRRYQA